MMNIDWKARFRSKKFWVFIISGIVGFVQLFGIKIFPDNLADILNTALGLLVGMGIIVDTSTQGIGDSTK